MKIKEIEIEMYPDGRMDACNAARYLGLSPKTLSEMRTWGTGPRFINRKRIFYYQYDLDIWLNKWGREIYSAYFARMKAEEQKAIRLTMQARAGIAPSRKI